jgi:hypothetical protein
MAATASPAAATPTANTTGQKTSTTERFVSSVPLPPQHLLTVEDIFGEGDKPNIELLKEHFV